jgi:hypothetical protein
MQVSEISSVSVNLTVAQPSKANFSVGMLLSDTAEVPLDKRYIRTTNTEFKTTFTSTTAHYKWLQSLWGQTGGSPLYAYLGRWVSAATGPYFVCNGINTTIATWAVVTDGSCTVTTALGADALTGLDFTGAEKLADIATEIQAKLTASGTSGATCTVDSIGRLVFSDPVADAAGTNTVLITGGGAGTDLVVAGFLNIANGFAQAGAAAETLDAALAAILALDNTPFGISERGATITQKVAFATAMQSYDKIYLDVINDTDAADGSSTTDAAYLIKDIGGVNKTYNLYSEHTADNPDAALLGEVFPQFPGSSNMALYPLSGVKRSGLAADSVSSRPLTSTERSALDAKGVDYLVTPVNATHFVNGLTPDGTEVRIMLGKMWLATVVSERVYNYKLTNKVVTYSEDDLNAIKSIIKVAADELGDVGLLDKDSYVWNMPSASSFNRATQATHIMQLPNVWTANTLNAVNKTVIGLTFNV